MLQLPPEKPLRSQPTRWFSGINQPNPSLLAGSFTFILKGLFLAEAKNLKKLVLKIVYSCLYPNFNLNQSKTPWMYAKEIT